MTLQTLAAALASGALLLGGCQSTHQHHSISIIELTEVPVDFAFAGVSSVPIPAGYRVREPNGIRVFERWSHTPPGLTAPVTYAIGIVGADRSVSGGVHGFSHAVFSCIEGCEQIADENVWERRETAYAVSRFISNNEDEDVFEPDSITQYEYIVGDSWCHGYGGIRRSDGLFVDTSVCAEQYMGADGSLNMWMFWTSDEALIPGAVNTLFASLPA